MVTWEKVLLFLSTPIYPEEVSNSKKTSLKKHVMVHFLFIAINRLIENDDYLLNFQLGAFIKNSIQSHSSSLKSPIKLIYERILFSIEGVSRLINKIIFIQPTVLELMILKDKAFALVMEIHITL